MKKIFFSLLVIGAVSFAACNNSKKSDKDGTKTESAPADNKSGEMASEKEHVCTDKCKDGNHVYAHGEKGHTCTAECKSM